MELRKYVDIFGKEGAKELSEQINIELLAEIPIVQSVREAADIGRPSVLQGSTDIAISLSNLAKEVIARIEKRNSSVVLFSPACSSLDEWKDFEERGNAFVKFVKNIKK